MAMLMLTAVGCFAVVVVQAAASGGVDAIQADMQQPELSWRRQLSAGNWQVRVDGCLSLTACGTRRAHEAAKSSASNSKLQCVRTGGFRGFCSHRCIFDVAQLPIVVTLLPSCVTAKHNVSGPRYDRWSLHH